MEKTFSIISSAKTLFFVLFLFSIILQAQGTLDRYEGIPIETSLDWWWVQNKPITVDSMQIAGVDIIHMSFPETNNLTTFFNRYNLDVLPITTPKPGGGVYNYIQYYTDAKYSVWEAEGTPNGKGNATLYKNPKTTIINNEYIRLNNGDAGDTCMMICGPYYMQDVEYETYEDGNAGHVLVQYTADFKLKLECIGLDNANPTDTLCILQVTQSTIKTTDPFSLDCTDTVKELALTRSDFTQLNIFNSHLLPPYTLENFSCDSTEGTIIPPPQYHFSTDFMLDGNPPGPRSIRQRIEYRVIWTGNPNYSLSIDKVILSDGRGSDLMDPESNAKQNLRNQLTSLSGYENSVFGWLGIDEPQSIDQYEPIRVVDSLLKANSQNQRPIVIPIMGCLWNGTYSHPKDIGAMGMNKYVEMKKRIGDVSIIQNAYFFDIPCIENSPWSMCQTGEDYRSINIRIAGRDIYKHSYTLDQNFGASLQCGAVYNDQANQRNVARHELLYSANLALMYGAKYLQFWRYFPGTDINNPGSGSTFHGIVDWAYDADSNVIPIYTDKYFMLRDTLSPRLKGLFGKTLKQLIPVADTLGKNATTNYTLNFEYIQQIRLANSNGTEALNSYIDIGTFNKPGEIGNNYFLVINRWYSNPLHNKFCIQFRNLIDFRNWNLMNYVDTTSVTLVSDINGAVPPSPVDTIHIGDAILYSIKPVAEFGGKLLVSEIVGDGMT
ncbi:MAG TPA: hypothetical protein PL018_12975, partial [Ignavibacteriaceae bacterium]|nr:hypothetical protein [Ignavibacteriaceae bacterium]